MKRMSHITTALRIVNDYRKIIFIRFNCDSFKVDGVIKKVQMKERYKNLIDLINNYKSENDLEIIYMYYDTTKRIPDIIYSPEYNEQLAKCVKDSIY